MIELRHTIKDVLDRTVEITPAVPPVVTVNFTLNQEMYVDRVVLVYRRVDDQPWQEWSVIASGDRRIKDGSRGKETKVQRYSSYDRDKRPDWLVELVNFFTPED